MAFIPRRDVKPIAKALEAKFGGPSGVLAAPAADLVKVDGVGETVAAYLKAVAELQSRASLQEIRKRDVISSWSALLEYVRREMQHETREQFRVLFLDRKNQLIADEVMSQGTVDQAPVYTARNCPAGAGTGRLQPDPGAQPPLRRYYLLARRHRHDPRNHRCAHSLRD